MASKPNVDRALKGVAERFRRELLAARWVRRYGKKRVLRIVVES